MRKCFSPRLRARYIIIGVTTIVVLLNLQLLARLSSEQEDSQIFRNGKSSAVDSTSAIHHAIPHNQTISLNSAAPAAQLLVNEHLNRNLSEVPIREALQLIALKRLQCISSSLEAASAKSLQPPSHISCVNKNSDKTRDLSTFCTDNVVLNQPDYVTLGFIKPNINLAVGIATVSRPADSYLINTLKDLFSKSTRSETEDVAFIVFLADLDDVNGDREREKQRLQENFPDQIRQGLLMVIEAPSAYYPPLNNLKRNYNDAPERVYWRAKQCVDFSFIFSFAHNISQYYLHLEDDVITKNGYLTQIKDTARLFNDRFFEIEFSHLGFIAKMFRSRDLLHMAAFHFYYHEEMPVDFLQPIYLRLASPDHPDPLPHYPSLFQHTGKKSSLKGKKQLIQDKLFDNKRLFTYRENHGLEAFSNIPCTNSHRAPEAISAAGFFWSKAAPKVGDWFTLALDAPKVVEYLVVVTGNANHPDDTALRIDVEISHKIVSRTRKSVQCGDLKMVTSFGPEGELGHNGVLGYNMTSLGPIECIRLRIGKPRPDRWFLISEIAVAYPGLTTFVHDTDGREKVVDWASHLAEKYHQFQRKSAPHSE